MAFTLENLDRFEQDILNDDLPESNDYRYGVSGAEDGTCELSFIKEARELIKAGRTVYYRPNS